MAKILVSMCLLGENCRYDGKNCLNEEIRELAKDHILIPICPEQMGGLSTPRLPSEIVNDRLVMKDGRDVTDEYEKGRQTALHIAELNDIDYVLLKSKSPSCGKGKIYDGSFSGKMTEGNGYTARLFLEKGYKVYSDEEIGKLKEELIDK